MLLDFYERTGDKKVLEMVQHTLMEMSRGGIYDQIGGGFHRYAVDSTWTVPHFEKMLYNQAQLLKVYARAFALTSETVFKRVADGIADYVRREMTAESGLFYSARDSEVEEEEGGSYVWTRDEIERMLSDAEYSLAAAVYGLEAAPNFEGDRYVLRWAAPYEQSAEKLGLAVEELFTRLDEINGKLLAARDRRTQPLLDDKSVAAWNGLMIEALAYAGEALNTPQYIERAAKAADTLLAQMRDDEDNFLHVARHGQAKLDAYLDDYAATIRALMQLHSATSDPRWRAEASNLADAMIENLWDANGGGFFQARPEMEDLLVRLKDTYDGAIPSGNSLAVTALTTLAASGLDQHAGYAADTLRAYPNTIERQPRALTEMVRGVVAYHEAALPLTAQVNDQPLELPTTAGLVKVSSRLTRKGGERELLTTLATETGWHVNANPASMNFLIPTEITVSADSAPVSLDITYPPGRESDTGLGQPIRIYRGSITISAKLGSLSPIPSRVTVRAQACNDAGRCLPPADIDAPVIGDSELP
jgi:uncharacterized protein YyaL (SSP411 family)